MTKSSWGDNLVTVTTEAGRPGVPVDTNQWSSSSKRSAVYRFPPNEYVDIHYSCWRCKTASVFTAEEQKDAFEVRKVYICQRRTLCSSCLRERRELEAQIRECRSLWAGQGGHQRLRRDPEFLKRWLRLLEALGQYGKRKAATINMLSRLLQTQA